MESIEEEDRNVRDMNTCFVTGGSGYVGYNLLLELLKREDWDITCMVFDGDNEILKKRVLDLSNENKGVLHLAYGNILEKDDVIKCLPDDLDCVFHVAGSTVMYYKLNKIQHEVNVNGTKNVLEVAIEKKVKRFIHTSSTSVYKTLDGSKKGEKITESSYKGALDGNFNYARTKYLGEKLVLDSCVKENVIDAVILQPNFILGEHDRLGTGFSRLFNKVYRKNLPFVTGGGGGFADVKQVARAMVSAYERGKRGQCYILGGEYMTHRELVAEIGRQLGMSEKEVPQFVPPVWVFFGLAWLIECGVCCSECWSSRKNVQPKITVQQVMSTSRIVDVDSSKAEKELGYQSTPIREMVKLQIEYMKKYGLFEYEI